jgi:hypothetical protein
MAVSEQLWAKIHAHLVHRSPQQVPTADDLEQRRQMVESMLPEPPCMLRAVALDRTP